MDQVIGANYFHVPNSRTRRKFVANFDLGLNSFAMLFLLSILISHTSATVVRWNKEPFDSSKFVFRRAVDDERFMDLKFTNEPQNLVVSRDSIAVFDCQVDSSESTVNWLFNSAPLDLDKFRNRIAIAENGSLIISRVEGPKEKQMNDEGIYQCIVLVNNGQHILKYVSKKAMLKVSALTRFEQQPTDKLVQVGDTVVFACRIPSYPPPSITWFKSDQPLDPNKNPRITAFPQIGSLEIRNAQLSDEAHYRCRATADGKYRESTKAQLKVTRPEFLAEPSEPALVAEPEGQVKVAGETAVFECAANGFPEPSIVWLKDQKIVKTDKKHRIMGQGTMIMHNVTAEDVGKYMCRATNSEDSVEASASLEVQVAPTFISKPLNVVSKETLDVSFECEAEGRPGPAVTWFKNGEVIVPSEYFVIEGTKLRVLGLVKTDQAIYQCLAENGAGSAQASAQLIVETAVKETTSHGNGNSNSNTNTELQPPEENPRSGSNPGGPLPSEPLGLRSVLVASRYISLRWDPPVTSNGNIRTYSVFYKQINSDRERVVNSTEGRGRELTINLLQPDTNYVIRVVAFNNFGPGLSSAPIKMKTNDEKAVPGQPQNVRGFALSSRSAEIRWEPPKVDSASVMYYRLFYAPAEAKDDETEIQVPTTYYVLHGLEEYMTYQFRVEAHAQSGAGLPSDKILLRTLSDTPSSSPTAISVESVDAQSIVIKWQAPRKEDRNGIIAGYRIKYKPKERGSKATTVTTEANKNSYLIEGLMPGTLYNVKIAATTVNGTGPSTKWETASTYDKDKNEDTLPSAVTKLMVQGRARSILISWLPPLDDGVMIRGYQIGYGVNVPDLKSLKVDANTRFYTLEGLTPMRNYIISIRAYNNIGAGFPMYETVQTNVPRDQQGQDDTPLETPVGLRALTEGSDIIRLNWLDRTAGFESGHAIRDGRLYEIRYGLQSGEPRYRYKNATDTTYLLDGLDPHTSYELSVRVVLGTRESQWSMTAANRTASAKPTSAPRDLTVISSRDEHKQALQLSWQPPKFANGPIIEYIVFYTTDPENDDALWDLEGVRGEKFTTIISDLLPNTVYYFKIQARNDVGYGPLSPVERFHVKYAGQGSGTSESGIMPSGSNLLYIIIGSALTIILLLILCIVVYCCRNKCNSNGRNGYRQGQKMHRGESKPPPDLWIDHAHARGSHSHDYSHGSPSQSMQDLKHTLHRGTPPLPPLDEPPRYQSLIAVSRKTDKDNMSRSVDQMEGHRRVGRAQPIIINPDRYSSEIDGVSNGTLTRSYHQQSQNSIEVAPISARQRTPQVVYTGPRNQQAARTTLDLDGTPTPPPSMSPGGLSSSDGNRTLPHRHSNNPLKSFAASAAPPPPGPPPTIGMPSVGVTASPARATHIVRPVPMTVPSPHRTNVGTTAIGGKPAGIVIGTKVSGRPRVQNQHHQAYATGSQSDANAYSDAKDTDNEIAHSYSNEELNVQMENLDHLMEDLKKMSTQEFDLV